jgi:hypothetical protein
LKKLFLSHYSGDAADVGMLAEQLRFRGIVPWVDKQGGFLVGDNNAEEARRALVEDCFGCLLYATPVAFTRPFVTDIEMPTAVREFRENSSYLIFAIPNGVNFGTLAELTKTKFGLNLADHHCIPVSAANLHSDFQRVARETLDKVIQGHKCKDVDSFQLQFSTRELLPHSVGEHLCIDGRSVFTDSYAASLNDLILGLQDVKSTIARAFGRPNILVNGSKHLSSAFLFGRVFQLFDLEIRQTADEYWSSRGVVVRPDLHVSIDEGEGNELVIAVASGYKDVLPGALAAVSCKDPSTIRVKPVSGRLSLEADTARGFVDAVYECIDQAVSRLKPRVLHLFLSSPQSTAMMLGKKFAGMPPAFLYEWNGSTYGKGILIPEGVL